MEYALESHDYDKFIQYEIYHYLKYIKEIEEKTHYENCLEDVELLSSRYGYILKKVTKKEEGVSTNTICYFLPSIDNDLAHIEILSRILGQHNPADFKIIVAGYSSKSDGCNSKYLNHLEESGKIDLLPLEQTHASLVSFINWLNLNKVAQLIVFSAPILIPAFISVLGAKRVTWFSSKFELECFPTLINRISCSGSEYQLQQIGKTTWHRMPAALEISNIPEYRIRKINNGTFRLVSINREEKIKNPVFLQSVVGILRENKNAKFYWTGKTEEVNIKSYFLNQGVGNRCHYIGWVNPKDVLKEFDIFLDTPSLSGSVAAAAFTAGIPLITFKNSQSWIEFFEQKFHQNIRNEKSSKLSFPLIAKNYQEYIKMACYLMSNRNLYNKVSEYQKIAGSTYFLDKKELYKSHTRCIQEVTNMSAFKINTIVG